MVFITTILGLFGLYFCTAVDYTPLKLRNVMYYGDWSIYGGQGYYLPRLIPGDQLTHLNFGFLDFDADGNIVLTDANAAFQTGFFIDGAWWESPNAGILPALQDLRTRYPNLRLGVSLGGWSKSGDFTGVASDGTKRANLVDQVIKFIEYNNFDFIDVDWEYPGAVRTGGGSDEGTPSASPQDGKLFIQLLRDFRTKENELATKTGKIYELSVALPATASAFQNGAQAYLPSSVTKDTATSDQIKTASTDYISALFGAIDFGNIMTYDLTGSWSGKTGHHSALYTHQTNESVDTIVSYLLGKTKDSKENTLTETLTTGVPAEKIVIGSAFYTQGWGTVTDDGNVAGLPGLSGSASNGLEQAAYGQLDTLKTTYSGLDYYYDTVAQAPYLYKAGGPFFTYDNPTSVAAKAAYVKANNLGGIISWMASQDATTGDESSGAYTTDCEVIGLDTFCYGLQSRSILTAAIKNGLFGADPLQQFNLIPDAIDVGVTVTLDSGKFQVGVTNKLQIQEARADSSAKDALYYSSRLSKTVTNPKLYVTLKSGVTVGSGGSADGVTWSQDGNVVTVNLYLGVLFLAPGDTAGAPGGTASVELPATKADGALDVSDITKIEISKQIYKNGGITGRVSIYEKEEDDGSGALDLGRMPLLARAVRVLMVLVLLIAGIGNGY